MPFFLRSTVLDNCPLGVWKIEEDHDYFLERLELERAEQDILNQLSDRKQLEWLASRWTLHLMSGRKIRGACLYDEFGKPYLEGSDYDISMSHSRNMVAVIAGAKPVGVDIQIVVPKIHRIKTKFLSEKELIVAAGDNELEMLHVMWGAKECLYKAYGKTKLAFATNIKISPFFYDEAGGAITGEVEKDDYFRRFNIEYRFIEDFVLVYAMESD